MVLTDKREGFRISIYILTDQNINVKLHWIDIKKSKPKTVKNATAEFTGLPHIFFLSFFTTESLDENIDSNN